MIIDINKKYKTMSGREVIICDVDTSQPDYQVIGIIIKESGEKTPESWCINGDYICFNNESHPNNLVEAQAFEISRSVYGNKEINYFGIKYLIPPTLDINYITTDDKGQVYGWTKQPIFKRSHGAWHTCLGFNILLDEIEFKGDTEQSLMIIE